MFRRVLFCSLIGYFIFIYRYACCLPQAGFRIQIASKQLHVKTLSLPSNATSIRDDIVDNFSCENKTYGYYADIDNDCQVFHVCLPVTYADGKNQTFRWSFICPESTIFSQEIFVCVREEDLNIKCEDSEDFYGLNDSFGDREEEEMEDVTNNGETNQGGAEMNEIMNDESMVSKNSGSGEQQMIMKNKRKRPNSQHNRNNKIKESFN